MTSTILLILHLDINYVTIICFPGAREFYRLSDLPGVDQGSRRQLLLQELCVRDAASGHGGGLYHPGEGPQLSWREIPGQDEPSRVEHPRAVCKLPARVSVRTKLSNVMSLFHSQRTNALMILLFLLPVNASASTRSPMWRSSTCCV